MKLLCNKYQFRIQQFHHHHLIHFKITEKWIIYTLGCHTNDACWLVVSNDEIGLIDCLMRPIRIVPSWCSTNAVHHLDLTTMTVDALPAAWDGCYETAECGKSSMSLCLVDSAGRARQSFGPLQCICGEHLLGYCSYHNLCSVVMYMQLSFVPARQVVQLPGTAHSIPRISQLHWHCLLFEDSD